MTCYNSKADRDHQHERGLETEFDLAVEKEIAIIEKCQVRLMIILVSHRNSLVDAYINKRDLQEVMDEAVASVAERNVRERAARMGEDIE